MTGAITSFGLLLVLSGQQVPAAPSTSAADSVQGVVQELRALRESVERVLSASARLQLLMGRLQLQEGRIQALTRQATEVDSRLHGLEAERNSLTWQQRMLERAARGPAEAADRELAREQLAEIQERLKGLEGRHAALLAELANVQQLIATEQSRWGDFNVRLEEIDRLLSGGPTGRRIP